MQVFPLNMPPLSILPPFASVNNETIFRNIGGAENQHLSIFDVNLLTSSA